MFIFQHHGSHMGLMGKKAMADMMVKRCWDAHYPKHVIKFKRVDIRMVIIMVYHVLST